MTFAEQLAAVEACIGRSLPERLREVYRTGAAERHGLLPLAMGREHEASQPGFTDVERFVDAQERFNSVLGHARGRAS